MFSGSSHYLAGSAGGVDSPGHAGAAGDPRIQPQSSPVRKPRPPNWPNVAGNPGVHFTSSKQPLNLLFVTFSSSLLHSSKLVFRNHKYFIGCQFVSRMSFADLGISHWLIKTLDDCGLKTPTPVQSECIGPTLDGKLTKLLQGVVSIMS